MAPPPERPYEIVFSGVQTARARALGEVAARRGLLRPYVTALDHALARLATDPLTWGDRYASLPHLGLILFHRSHAPLNLFYAVDPLRRIVYIKDIDPLPGAGLESTK